MDREVKEYSIDQETFQDTDSIHVSTLEQEKKLIWKLDRRILPLTCTLYLFACVFLHVSCLKVVRR